MILLLPRAFESCTWAHVRWYWHTLGYECRTTRRGNWQIVKR